MKTKIKITIGIIIAIAGMLAYNAHHDQQMDDYARTHNCTWTVQGAHDICK